MVTITDLGIITSLGDDIGKINAAVNAGINRFSETDIYGSDDDPVRLSCVPEAALESVVFNRGLRGRLSFYQKRLLRLAILAARKMASNRMSKTIPLFLAGPENYCHGDVINSVFLESLMQYIPFDINSTDSCFINGGRTGSMVAIQSALAYLQSGKGDTALVGAVDSFYDDEVLGFLDEHHRLLKMDGSDGFIPGEGAVFLLLKSVDAARGSKLKSFISMQCPALHYQQKNTISSHALSADLSRVIASCLDNIDMHTKTNDQKKIKHIISGENGEMQPAKVLNVAITRNQKSIDKNYLIHRPAQYLGDLGAAFVPAAIALAGIKMRMQYIPNIVICCISDSGVCGALSMRLLAKD
ncbi:beta-ketoacyl synthase N-terminal-like domain-containing protein [Agarilytica rhodophyticola]|uniref:beta-ketoacyl synthase N-terminal-like domain-containing protein n=1 Tax=Agarilytica rhodophyticola TaxID=1737490 RepID=UPI000B345BAD|nr:beta-ketoacyl synthase N-terminal-like domain-containing protein [Agarilytica rhodophyticola]